MKEELRNLMYSYAERQAKLDRDIEEADERDEDTETLECLNRQCRIMIAQLWKVMVKVGALDDEEVEFGNIKIK